MQLWSVLRAITIEVCEMPCSEDELFAVNPFSGIQSTVS